MRLVSPYDRKSPEEIKNENLNANGGYFALGLNGFYHTGIHLKIGQEVRAIADGNIIAYRINKNYPQFEEKGAPVAKSTRELINGMEKEYSTSFVLIKHDYTTIHGLQIEFYTLYMQLMCMSELKSDANYQVPFFIGDERYFVKNGARIYEKTDREGSSVHATRYENVGEQELFPFQNKPEDLTHEGIPGTYYPSLRSATDKHFRFYVKESDVRKEGNEIKYDEVISFEEDEAIPVKAGQTIGYPGVDQMIHLELFTREDAFMNQGSNFYKEDAELAKKHSQQGAGGFNLYHWGNYFQAHDASEATMDLKAILQQLKPQTGTEYHDDLKNVGSIAGYAKLVEPRGDNSATIRKVIKDPKKSAYINRLYLKGPTEWSCRTATKEAKYQAWEQIYSCTPDRIDSLIPYLDSFLFYDEVPCLPAPDNLCFFHPITFIEHLRKIEEQFPGVIMYPSLLCPAIVDVADPILPVFVLTDGSFKHKEEEMTRAGREKDVRRILSTLLKLESWRDVAGKDNGKLVNEPGELFDPNHPDFQEGFTDGSLIDYKPIGEIQQDLSWLPLEGTGELIHFQKTENGKEISFDATLAKWGLEAYYNQGFKHGYLLTINLEPFAPQQPDEANRLRHIAWNPALNQETNLWTDTQDALLYDYLTSNQTGRGEKHSPLYQVESISEIGIGALQECDKAIKPAAWHPVFFTDKDYLNFAQLSDVHLDVRQYLLEDSKAQLMPGEEPDKSSTVIGHMVTNTNRVFAKALQVFGRDEKTDLLFLTGDLVNQTSNVDPVHYRKNVKSPQAIYRIWEGVHIGGDFKDNDHHQWNIDSRLAMSLLLDYYDRYQKPIVSLIGNHEDFPLPYGISPRVANMKRADEMMCADHNLTYAEAILMFGKSYSQIVYDEGSSALNLNMDPHRRFFFHHFFNPLADFIINTRNQSFLCLDWEEGQNLIDFSGQHVGGHLTRAANAVSDLQLRLIDQTLNSPQSKKILFSHFAYLSFKENIPLTKQGALVETKRVSRRQNRNDSHDSNHKAINPSHDFAHGSFDKNRERLYETLFKQTNTKTFDYIISGHTHRAGAYHVTHCTGGSSVQFEAQAVSDEKTPRTENPLILIAGCGGPIAKQNLHGEFDGWGHDAPNGNIITYDPKTGNDTYRLIRIEKDSAFLSVRPRFAVAVDYFNIMNDEKWFEDGFFTRFELKHFGGSFTGKNEDEPIYDVEVNQKAFPGGNSLTIHSMILYCYDYGSGTFFPVNSQMKKLTAGGRFVCLFDKSEFEKLMRTRNSERNKDRSPIYFLSVTFAPIKEKEFKNYDYQSPWLYRVDAEEKDRFGNSQFGSSRQKSLEGIAGIKRFRTHRRAEIPDFRWYQEHFESLYLKPDF